MQDKKAMKELVEKMAKQKEDAFGKNADLMSKAELAANCLNPERLLEINNVYYVLKKLPGTKGLKLNL